MRDSFLTDLPQKCLQRGGSRTGAVLLSLVLGLCAVPSRAAPSAPLTVRFAPEKDYGPFVYQDGDGVVRGLSVDLLERVQRQAGLNVVMLEAAPLAQQLQAVRDGRADLLSSLRPTPERAADLAFSTPYVSVPAVLLVPSAAGRTARLLPEGGQQALQALAGEAVAVGESYAVQGFVQQRFPAVRWVAVPDDAVALRGVADGRFAGAVVDAASATFLQQRERLPRLHSAGSIGFEYVLSFAVPRHRGDLITRIDAALLAIPAAERRTIVERWMVLPEQRDATPGALHRAPVQWGLGLIGAAALGALALAVRQWQRSSASRRSRRAADPADSRQDPE